MNCAFSGPGFIQSAHLKSPTRKDVPAKLASVFTFQMVAAYLDGFLDKHKYKQIREQHSFCECDLQIRPDIQSSNAKYAASIFQHIMCTLDRILVLGATDFKISLGLEILNMHISH